MTWTRLLVFLTSWVIATSAMAAKGDDDMASEKNWEVAYESGALWRVGGGGSQLDYVLLPQLLTWRTPEVTRWLVGGRELIVRSRFSVLAEPFAKGPESYFLGGAAGGLLEWWTLQRTQAFFFSSGGGVGLMNSKGYEIEGAQGQDFNFHWFAYAGIRFQRRGGLSASLGVYFQHVSNTGLDKINPGIDAVGPMMNIGWRF
jgi:hypothetical protein